jgi:hypothetical protein
VLPAQSKKEMENGEVMTGMENGEATKIGLRLIGLRLSLCIIALCIVLLTAGISIGQRAGL